MRKSLHSHPSVKRGGSPGLRPGWVYDSAGLRGFLWGPCRMLWKGPAWAQGDQPGRRCWETRKKRSLDGPGGTAGEGRSRASRQACRTGRCQEHPGSSHAGRKAGTELSGHAGTEGSCVAGKPSRFAPQGPPGAMLQPVPTTGRETLPPKGQTPPVWPLLP